jgi:NADH-quinone oxidoreductase subunit E
VIGNTPIGTEHKTSGAGKVPTLSNAAETKLQEIITRYPQKKSAVMPALYIAQEELGWISPEAVEWVANRLELPTSHVYEVASFYTMYYKRPVGRFHVQVCRTLSCQLVGARKLVDRLENRLGLQAGEVSADGMWSFEEVECLGSCGTAPMCQINDVFFEKLSPERLDEIIEQISVEKPDLRYSTIREELGKGMPEQSRSQVWGKKA